ncbi:MAG: flippase [Pyrinomonadaceae bacterium]
MTTKVVKGSLWTLAGQVAPLAVSLIATPFTIRLLGSEGYGVLIFVGLIPAYFGFADLGMGLASTKFGSEAYAASDPEREARTVRTAAILALISSLPFAIAIFLLSGTLATLFNVPAHLHSEASLAFKVASFTFVLDFLNNIFNTPQLDRLRMDLNTFATSGVRILGVAATPIVIYFGGGVLGAVMVLLAASLLTLACHVYTSGRLLPDLYGLSLDRGLVRPMVKFGGGMAISAIASMTMMNFEKAALPKLTSMADLAYYSVAFTLAFTMTLFSVALAQSLIPAFSQLQGSTNRAQLSGLYSRAIRMNLFWLTPVLVLLAIYAKPLITLWAGPDFGRESTRPFYILLIGVGFHVIATPARAALMASGRSDVIAKTVWLELLPYITIVVVLTLRFGGIGAAIAWSLRAVVDAVVSFWLTSRVSKVWFIFRGTSAFILATVIMSAPFLLLEMMIPSSYLAVSAVTAGSLILFAIIVLRNVLESDELEWLKGWVDNRFGRE